MRTHTSRFEPWDQINQPEDALAMLSADHQRVTELFEDFQTALEILSPEQKSLCDEICDELEIHSQLEEEIFYPAVISDASIRPLVEEALDAHAEIKTMIEQIRNLQPDDPLFGASMLELIDDVERHVDEEENILFAEVEKRLGDQLVPLGHQLEERKRELVEMLNLRIQPE
jgi:hemerythrin-like domain-containing protein